MQGARSKKRQGGKSDDEEGTIRREQREGRSGKDEGALFIYPSMTNEIEKVVKRNENGKSC